MEERASLLAELQMRENGKTITECRGQVRSAAAILRYFAGVCETAESEVTKGIHLGMSRVRCSISTLKGSFMSWLPGHRSSSNQWN